VAVEGARDGGVGNRLRTARQHLGLALDDLPALTGGQFTAAAVGSYERGFRTATVERMAALCGYYNIPLVEVLTGHPAPPNSPPPPEQPAAPVSDVAAAQQTRALRRLTSSIASRRTRPGTDAPAHGAPRLRHGDYEVLALALNTTPARLQQLAAKAKPRPSGAPVPPVLSTPELAGPSVT